MSEIAVRLEEIDSGASLVVAVVIFVAFGVKLGLFPFHFWLPAVYTSASPGVAAMLSGALANIGSYGVLRFGGEVLAAELRVGATVVLVLGIASILYGAFQALSRRTAAEVLAYSAIGQVGYILVAIALGGPVGYAAAVLYSVVNSLNKGLLFLVTEMRGWIVAAAFAIGALSVAGLPPSAGFLGKLVLFQTGIEADSVAIVALLFVGGGLSFVYMFQIYQHDFWRGERPSQGSPVAARALAAGMAVLILALGLWPEPLLAASREAASVLPDAGP
jgi:multicomponent Na+:H+ antiporter subunit D